MSVIIDGQRLAEALKQQLVSLRKDLEDETGTIPGLAVLRVGKDPASKIYAETKRKQAIKLGFNFQEYPFPETASVKDIESQIEQLNHDPNTHGIIIQLPLPKHLEVFNLLSRIAPEKDVDGIHPLNAGKLFEGGTTPFIPSAPLACLNLIKSVRTNLEGMEAGIIGSSFLVGRPMAMLMLKQNCTVRMAHIKTRDLANICKSSDILIVAIGKPNFIQGNWIKQGAIVIDVGVNRLENNDIVGDVDFTSAAKKSVTITPVPGGVGPMTVACLLGNTLKAAFQLSGKAFPFGQIMQ